MTEKQMRKNRPSRLIGEYDKFARLIRVFPNTSQASTYTGHPFTRLTKCIEGHISFLDNRFFISYSHKLTDEEIQEELQKRLDREKERQKPKMILFCYQTDGTFLKTFHSYKEASAFSGETIPLIHSQSNAKNPRNPSYWWLHQKDYPTKEAQDAEIERLLVEKRKKSLLDSTKQQKIFQYNRQGKSIGEYTSLQEASQKTEADETFIGQIMLGQRSGAYKWIFLSGELYPTEEERKTEVRNRLMKIAKKGGRNKEDKPLIQLNVEGKKVAEYDSADEAHKETGLSRKRIMEVAKKKDTTYQEHFFLYKDDFSSENELIEHAKKTGLDILKRRSRKPVIAQYTMDGVRIATFNTMTEASQKLSISQSAISFCVTGKSTSSNGFIFLRPSDYGDTMALQEELQRRVKKKKQEAFNKKKAETLSVEKESEMTEKEESNSVPEKSKPGRRKGKSKRKALENILHYDLDGRFIAKYSDSKEAFYRTGVASTTIRNCSDGQTNASNGTVFLLEEDYQTEDIIQEEIEIRLNSRAKVGRTPRPIVQLTKDGEFVQRFPSSKEAEKRLGISQTMINNSVFGRSRGASAYVFLNEEEFASKEAMKQEVLRRFS